jgi:hypothetical protein
VEEILVCPKFSLLCFFFWTKVAFTGIYCLVQSCFGVGFILQCMERGDIRARYRISGNA